MKSMLSLPSLLLGFGGVVLMVSCARSGENPAVATPENSGATVAAAPTGRNTGSNNARPVRVAQIDRREEVPDGKAQPNGLTMPGGFTVSVFADGLEVPRRIAIAPGSTPQKYDVFVSESRADRVRVLRETNGDGKADERFIYTDKTSQPYGLSFHPGGWLYVGNTDEVVRFPYKNGATSTDAKPESITELTRGGYNQHWTRNVIFSPDYKKLYVTVGSSCNTCEEGDSQRAAISVMNPDGSQRRLFATGLRNPVGMDWRPGTQELWTVVNERDQLGDDVPPDYLTLVKDGGFYGWPYAYTDISGKIHPDPQFGKRNPEKVKQTTAPTVPVQAHSAALGVAFYPVLPDLSRARLAAGSQLFPPEYSGDAFLAFHGSWNRSQKTGYKIVRVDFKDGQPVSVTDFVTGFLTRGGVSGRPVDVHVAPDGSLLFSDDGAGKIWRVAYTGKG